RRDFEVDDLRRALHDERGLVLGGVPDVAALEPDGDAFRPRPAEDALRDRQRRLAAAVGRHGADGLEPRAAGVAGADDERDDLRALVRGGAEARHRLAGRGVDRPGDAHAHGERRPVDVVGVRRRRALAIRFGAGEARGALVRAGGHVDGGVEAAAGAGDGRHLPLAAVDLEEDVTPDDALAGARVGEGAADVDAG